MTMTLGTLVRNEWVLATKGCVLGVDPSDLSVQMTSTHGGPTQSSFGAEFYSHPQIDVALIKLASPFAIGGGRTNYVKPLGSGVPNRQLVRCFGMDWSSGGALKSMRFWASGGSWNFYRIDDPDQALETWDHGGFCVIDEGTQVGPIIGVISTVGRQGSHAAVGFIHDTNWIEDMINLSRVATLNQHTSNRIQSTFDFLCLDVADGSVWPNVHVNQYTCHDGLNQRWYFTNAGHRWDETHFQSLVSVNSGKCLEVGPDNRLRQNSCTGAHNQIFGRHFFAQGWALVNPAIIWFLPDFCADIPGFSTALGEHIQMYPCNFGSNQAWRSW